MEKPRYKIYERDVKGGLKFIGASEDRKDIAVKFERMEGSVHFDLVLMKAIADEEEILAVRKCEKANLEYINGLLSNFGLDKAQVKEAMSHIKMYKYKKCDEMRSTAKVYASKYITMPEKNRVALMRQLDLLPHPQD